MEKILQNRLDRLYKANAEEYERKAIEVLRSGWYLLGKETELFEKEFADYIGVKHCIGTGNGTDALYIALKVLEIGKGDEVLVPANTFIADAMSIVNAGATPKFIDCDSFFNIDTGKISDAITEHTKAIIAVHLYGQCADMKTICEIAEEHGLYVIEDCAQSHGAAYYNKKSGSFGDISCFSFYPAKNLGAFGDGGAVLTDNDVLAEKIRAFRYYGSSKRYYYDSVGINSRLDEIQAGLLRVRLGQLPEIISQRQYIANAYLKGIKNDAVQLPRIAPENMHVWHQFVIVCKKREQLAKYLSDNNIMTAIHYPVPAYRAAGYSFLNENPENYPNTEQFSQSVLSLPIYNGMTDEEIQFVIETLNSFNG